MGMKAEIRMIQPHDKKPKDDGGQETLEEAWNRFPARASPADTGL